MLQQWYLQHMWVASLQVIFAEISFSILISYPFRAISFQVRAVCGLGC